MFRIGKKGWDLRRVRLTGFLELGKTVIDVIGMVWRIRYLAISFSSTGLLYLGILHVEKIIIPKYRYHKANKEVNS